MPLLRDLPPDERERLTSVIWAAQDPRSPTCDYCGAFRSFGSVSADVGVALRVDWAQCRCEARRRASRPQREGGA